MYVKRVVRIADTSKPSEMPPKGFSVVAGYIGGDTPHVWTKSDWDKFPKWHKLPIFVRSQTVGATGGEEDAFTALRELYTLNVPRGSVVVYDREGNDDAAATEAFFKVLHWSDYHVWPYGSVDNIFNHPPCDGYAVANPTGIPHMYDHPDVMWTQYKFDDAAGYDEGEVRFWQAETRLMVNWP